MRKVITIVVSIALLLCCLPSMAENALDFSNLSDEQLQYLIDAALAEQASRKSSTIEEIEPSVEDTSADLFEASLAEQPLYITEARFTVQSEDYKALYPDLLQAIFVNNSNDDIKNATIAFAAWDENNLPVMLKAQFDFNSPAYIRVVNYNAINMVPGSTFGEKTGMKLDESVKSIVTVKAVAVSYEAFDGTTWENPLYSEFKEMYEGKKLE